MNDELHHQLPNNLRLKNSGKEKIAGHFVHTKTKKVPKMSGDVAYAKLSSQN